MQVTTTVLDCNPFSHIGLLILKNAQKGEVGWLLVFYAYVGQKMKQD